MKKRLLPLISVLLTAIVAAALVSCDQAADHEHSLSEWVTVTEPKCNSEGIRTRSCSICNNVISAEMIPMTDKHTPVTDAAVSATETQEGLTEGSHCSVCGKIMTPQTIILPTLKGTDISTKSGELNGSTISYKLPNSSEHFAVSNDIAVSASASYTLFSDELGSEIIENKVVSLSEGSNVFYLTVKNGEESKHYTLSIYRAKLLSVSFDTKGGTPIAEKTVEEGYSLSESIGDPVLLGYDFTGWDKSLDSKLTEDTVFTAVYQLKEDMEDYIFTSTDSELTVTGLANVNDTHYFIPDYVTAISKGAFSSAVSVESVTFESLEDWWYTDEGSAVCGIELIGLDNKAIDLLFEENADIAFYHTKPKHNLTHIESEADCTSGGFKLYTCVNCGYQFKADVTEPLGHDYAVSFVPPTATENGYNVYTCTVCGDSYDDKKPTRPRPPVVTDDLPEGYAIYETFNDRAQGAYTGTAVNSVNKNGVTYSVVPADKPSIDGSESSQALHVYRNASEITTDRDGYINATPKTSKLNDVYVLAFDLMVTPKTTVSFDVNGRKSTGGTQFNKFISFNASTRALVANNNTVSKLEDNRWYNIALVINDEARTYDVYLDGWKMFSDVQYANANYPNRSDAEINLYRFTMSGGTSENEFYIDDIAIYQPDENGRPNNYQGSMAMDMEEISMPQITVFDVSSTDWEDIADIAGSTAMNKLIGYGSDNGSKTVSLNNAFRPIKVNTETGDWEELAENWGDELGEIEEGWEKYLMLDGYKSGFNNASFKLDLDLLRSLGIPVRSPAEVKKFDESFQSIGGSFCDFSAYSKLSIELFIPEEVFSSYSYYQFMLYIDSGTRNGGISYYSNTIYTNNGNFADAVYTLELDLNKLSQNRNASLSTVSGISLKFSGWTNGVNGNNAVISDEYPIAIKSIKLSGGLKVPTAPAADDKADCAHVDGELNSLMTETVVIPSTCTAYGYTGIKCTNCGKVLPLQDLKFLTQPLGHDYGSADSSEPNYNPSAEIIYPTCTSGGSATAECMNGCGSKKVIENYSPLGHTAVLKFDNVNGSLITICTACGNTEYTSFSESLPEHGTVSSALKNAGINKWWGMDLDNDTSIQDRSDSSFYYEATTGKGGSMLSSSNGMQIILRNNRLNVLDNFGVDNVGRYVRYYNTAQNDEYGNPITAHNYMTLYCNSGGTPDSDCIFEFTYRLGAPTADGKYPYGDFQIIDRSSEATGGANWFYSFASQKDDGRLTFVNTDFEIQFSEEHFTQVAIAFHFSSNTYDIYENGVMKVMGATLCAITTVNVSLVTIDELRIFQYNGGMVTNSYTDIASCYVYSGVFPVTVLGAELEDSISSENWNAFVNAEFDTVPDAMEDTDGIAAVENGKLSLNNGGSDNAFVEFSVTNGINSHYVISMEFIGNASSPIRNVPLLSVTKQDGSYTVTEDLLTVDSDGDILFYGRLIGSAYDSLSIEIRVDELSKKAELYVEEVLICSLYIHENEYFSAPSSSAPITSFRLGCSGNGGYSLESFKVIPGYFS